MPLSARYNSKEIESRWYTYWETGGYFRPKSDKLGKHFRDRRYVIVIPPPNVTGILHMGHALNNSIQDILIRWQRMKGKDALWVPGVDHAGIATQNVVEKKLAREKKSRHDVGRENFLKEVWKWKEAHGNTITRQLRRLGAACDWTRERFTMDRGLSDAVRETFVLLYERGLIYRGHYIINWCPRCQTALSDEESAHKEVRGGLYYVKYPIQGKGGRAEKIGEDHVVVATTRPETMLGDTAVAIHPEDGRYRHLLGQKVVLPLLNREIPVIADEFVDREFGTGMVKVTPAHDPNDFEIGLRHDLPRVNVLHPDGRINENGGPYSGMDRFEARKKIIRDLEEKGLFIKRDSHLHAVGHCYRCDTVVEPYLSRQWFVRMKPLAQKALAAHRAGKTVFYPDRWTKVYTHWLENIRDWCISRQIWWGHQIPVWYCGDCVREADEGKPGGKGDAGRGIIVARGTPEKCPECGGTNLTQDPDVLDTWFSSWLWPFSTLGWPAQTEDLKYFYPTSDLITAPEIIFFWVARMIMAGCEFMEDVPFSRIYIHGTVRAQSGLKMSKSLGNAIDPLEVIDETGADALRFSLVMLSAQDVYLSREKFEVGRNFTNKIWNAFRFALMNLEGFGQGGLRLDEDARSLPLVCRWILSRFDSMISETDRLLSNFSLAQACGEVYHFIWNDFCDWFIEVIKPALAGPGRQKAQVQKILFVMLERICRMLHPFMPFISEELWQKLKEIARDRAEWPDSIMSAAWPLPIAEGFCDPAAEASLRTVQRVVGSIRNIRTQLRIAPSQKVKVVVDCKGAEGERTVRDFQSEITKLANVETLDCVTRFVRTQSYVGDSFADMEVFVFVEGLADMEKERLRIQKQLDHSKRYEASLRKKLTNEKFISNAPADVVDRERVKLMETEKVIRAYEKQLGLFGGGEA